FYCERVFAPWGDYAAALRQRCRPLVSLETGTPLAGFDLVGFSLQYEMAYTNVLAMLELGGIPLAAAERRGLPLVIAGGPAMVNPEPIAPAFDAVLIGDGEEAFPEMAAIVRQGKLAGADREEILRQLAAVEGVYVPAFLAPGRRVQRRICRDLTAEPLPTAPPVPLIKVVHDRLALEISRGCSRGCRFCQAGMIYRPVRERPVAELLAGAAEAHRQTGVDELSLLSLSVGDYHHLLPLVTGLRRQFDQRQVNLSLPSVRAGLLTDELLQVLRRGRQGGFTIAPEAGSQRLRDSINKGLTENDILITAGRLFANGWDLLKFYFMIGLPGETDDDLEAIVELCRRALGTAKSKRQRINVSVSTFVPKPHTPFQWESQIGLEETRRRQEWLRERLRPDRRLQLKWHDRRVSLLEGVFSRGDRRLWPVLLAAYRRGCLFDAWSDQFNFTAWQQAFAEQGLDLEELATRPRAVDEPLPWDHIDVGVRRDFLLAERQRAAQQLATPDCREAGCQGCGVCRPAAGLRPVIQEGDVGRVGESPVSPPPAGRWEYLLAYRRRPPLIYLAHLETVNLFIRGLRRLGVELLFSQGFHPHPRLSFAHALPLGLASEEEFMTFTAVRPVDTARLAADWSRLLPAGLEIIACTEQPAGLPALDHRLTACLYEVEFTRPAWRRQLPDFCRRLAAGQPLPWTRRKKGRPVTMDFASHLEKAVPAGDGVLQLTVKVIGGRNPNIYDLVSSLVGAGERVVHGYRVVKKRSFLSGAAGAASG
ncbi:MAG: TIGR03960 family B12-binding radical SAM protein, partial [Deltaproteobacteria bacterium]|nr:TIGR03960 family B12-binding radical SAM protein [Deltaproteobacteria bacterium]